MASHKIHVPVSTKQMKCMRDFPACLSVLQVGCRAESPPSSTHIKL